MEKVMIGKMPAGQFPAAIVGAMVNGKANYNLVGCFGMIATIPPITVYINSAKFHYTNIGIRETGYFSVNLPSPDLMQKADYVGLVSGKDTDKSGVFESFFGAVDKAPMARECPVNILCKVVKTVNDLPDLPNSEVFIGQVQEVYVSKDCMTDGKPNMKKLNLLSFVSGQYWDMGNPVGVAWSEGKALIKKEAACK